MTTVTTPADRASDAKQVFGSSEPGGSAEPADVVDHLLGVRPGDRLDEIRATRPEARANAQKAYEALFQPVDDAEFSVAERFAVATFVVGLHGAADVRDFYATRLAATFGDRASAVVRAVEEEAARVGDAGPYGVYREPGLAAESLPGPAFEVADEAVLGGRLSVALEHAYLLVLRPREATPEALDRLLRKGWSTTGIVTLSQLVAFLAFQVRVVHGLRQLATHETEGAR